MDMLETSFDSGRCGETTDKELLEARYVEFAIHVKDDGSFLPFGETGCQKKIKEMSFTRSWMAMNMNSTFRSQVEYSRTFIKLNREKELSRNDYALNKRLDSVEELTCCRDSE